ncbi:hypothetical protein EON80_08595, partial [bacterium]
MIFFFVLMLICLAWGVVWLVSVGDLLFSKSRQSEQSVAAAKGSFIRTSLFGVGLGVVLYILLFPPLWLVFSREFGRYPWFAVSQLRGSSEHGADFKQVEMRFYATPEKVQQLAQAKGLQ